MSRKNHCTLSVDELVPHSIDAVERKVNYWKKSYLPTSIHFLGEGVQTDMKFFEIGKRLHLLCFPLRRINIA